MSPRPISTIFTPKSGRGLGRAIRSVGVRGGLSELNSPGQPTGYYKRPDGGADTIEVRPLLLFILRTLIPWNSISTPTHSQCGFPIFRMQEKVSCRISVRLSRQVDLTVSGCPSSRHPHSQYNHYFLLRRVLAILSLGMGLPEDAYVRVESRF
jgi:hypothetical protein